MEKAERRWAGGILGHGQGGWHMVLWEGGRRQGQDLILDLIPVSRQLVPVLICSDLCH